MTKTKPPIGEQTELASKPSHARRRHLRIIDPLRIPTNWELKPGVPATRADCPSTTDAPCPYVSCRHHLWLVEQRDRAGNPEFGAQGAATFRASTNETCALDVAELGPASFEEIAAMLGVDRTRVRQIEEKAREKLRAAGYSLEEYIR